MTFYIDIKGKLVNTSTDRGGYKFRKIRVNTIPFLHSFYDLELLFSIYLTQLSCVYRNLIYICIIVTVKQSLL